MPRWRRPAASLLTVLTLAGSPALWSACVALCMPGMRGHVMTAAGPDSPAVGCPEHEADAPAVPAAAVTASAAACCVDGLTAAAPSVAAERADTRLALATVLASMAAWTSAPRPSATMRAALDRGSPPPPVRRPSVLRI